MEKKKEEESLCTLMLADWPQESSKESGSTTTGPHINCKSFKFTIEWNTWAWFPFPNCLSRSIHQCVNDSFIWALFIWSYSPGLEFDSVFFLCRWPQRRFEGHRGGFINLYLCKSIPSSPSTPHILFLIHFQSNGYASLNWFIRMHILLSWV